MESFARDYGIKRIYFSYEEMLGDPELDAVYVAVPNHLHYNFCRMALLRGLHVLCEKPFCGSLRELEELKDLAEERELFLFEAISNQYLPNYKKLQELLPEIGRVRIVEINFSQYSSRYDGFLKGDIAPVFDPDKKGGALMDLNVYNIHFVVGLFGEPEKAQYFPNVQMGIDTSGTLILQYSGFICILTAAKDCYGASRISIQGEKGCAISEGASNSFERFELRRASGETEIYELNEGKGRLYHELRAWADMYQNKNAAFCQTRMQQSLRVQEIIDIAAKLLEPFGIEAKEYRR